jgi:uncharacterized membrane protein YjgN (DUF898 family)
MQQNAAVAADGVIAPATGESTSADFPLQSSASGGEYFRIWIVNLLLTLLTLGIYSAWAKVRRLRYFYGSTSLADTSFEYHGQPLPILKGRLIAFGVLLVYAFCVQFAPVAALLFLPIFFFGLPWVVVRARLFQMRMSSWRNVRFGFHGSYGGAFAAYIGWALVAVLTLYLLTPLWLHKRTAYILENTSFGAQRFAFTKPVGTYFAFVYVAVALGIVAVLVAGALLGGAFAAMMAAGSSNPPNLSGFSFGPLQVLALLLALVLGFVVVAYYNRSYTNAAFDGLELGPHRLRCKLEVGRLFWIYLSNFIGIVLTLGLFYPWAKVRTLRYQVESMSLEAQGSLDRFVAEREKEASALGEEFGEAFDVDFGL